MTCRDDYLDAMFRHLGAAYYQALHGDGSAAEVTSAVRQVSEATRDGADPAATEDTPGRLRRGGRLQVSDVMTTNVIAVTEETSYRKVAELQSKHHFTALPVVNSEGQVIGVVSGADLLRKQERHERGDRTSNWPFNPKARTKAEARTARQLMTSPAITIRPDALLGSAARLMNSHHVKLLPVVGTDSRLVGIVSRADLIRVFMRPDNEIAADATDVLTAILLADPAAVRVTANEGIVTLRGRLASDEQVSAAVRLVEAIDGVVGVTSELHSPGPENWPGGGYHLPL